MAETKRVPLLSACNWSSGSAPPGFKCWVDLLPSSSVILGTFLTALNLFPCMKNIVRLNTVVKTPRFHRTLQAAQVRSLVSELKTHILGGVAKTKKKKIEAHTRGSMHAEVSAQHPVSGH